MTPDSASRRCLQSPAPDHDLDWEEVIEGISAGSVADLEDDVKILRLAREVKRLASLMTAGRDLHDIQTTLHLVAHWPYLQQTSRRYAQHHLRLLYLAATKGWPAAIYYDTQAEDEFIPAEPGFWSGFKSGTWNGSSQLPPV
jgi:hypothetical protein